MKFKQKKITKYIEILTNIEFGVQFLLTFTVLTLTFTFSLRNLACSFRLFVITLEKSFKIKISNKFSNETVNVI